jgi:hypothetical protein
MSLPLRLLDHAGGRVRDVPCPGRRADLIGDDAKLVVLARQPQNGVQEIVPARRIDPAGAQDQVIAAGVADGELAGELAAPIGAQRRGRVVFITYGPGFAPSNTYSVE